MTISLIALLLWYFGFIALYKYDKYKEKKRREEMREWLNDNQSE